MARFYRDFLNKKTAEVMARLGWTNWKNSFATALINIAAPAFPCNNFFGAKRAIYRTAGLVVGRGAKLGSCISIYSQGIIMIGENVWLGRAANFNVPNGAKVMIGESCDIAPYVKFMCGSHLIGPSSRRAGSCTARDIVIGNGCWIGTSVTILGGAIVGHGTVIAAGSVVLPRAYPPNVLLAGVPAKPIRGLEP
jgi:maltose O-acetyltransferase